MDRTRLSSKGQVIIPKSIRDSREWHSGLELEVIDTEDGVLLKPSAPFAPTRLSEVAGMLAGKVTPRTDEEIDAALREGVRKRWRDRG